MTPAHGTQHESRSRTASLLRGDVTNGEEECENKHNEDEGGFLRQRVSACSYKDIKEIFLIIWFGVV